MLLSSQINPYHKQYPISMTLSNMYVTIHDTRHRFATQSREIVLEGFPVLCTIHHNTITLLVLYNLSTMEDIIITLS